MKSESKDDISYTVVRFNFQGMMIDIDRDIYKSLHLFGNLMKLVISLEFYYDVKLTLSHILYILSNYIVHSTSCCCGCLALKFQLIVETDRMLKFELKHFGG